LGGICLNWGCIPTKALLRTAELYTAMRHASEFGLACDNVRFDLPRIIERSRKVAERLSNGVAYLMKKNKIEVIKGTARLRGQGRVAVIGNSGEVLPDIEAPHIIVATGARARTLPGLEPDERLIWSYREAMVPKSSQVVAHRRLGRHWHRVRQLLSQPRRRGDSGGDAAARPALR
jgi:dihydrolipoamide dehydrogenase